MNNIQNNVDDEDIYRDKVILARIPTRDWAEYKLQQHDRYSFEAKFEYLLKKEINENEYFLDIFFFLPRALRIDENSYKKDMFFADMVSYIRLKTPRISLNGLINPENELSPIYKIRILLKQLEDGNIHEDIESKLIYEIKLLGCIVRTNLIRQISYFIKEYTFLRQNKAIIENLRNFIHIIENFRGVLKGLRNEFSNINLPLMIRDSYFFVDDYISFQIQNGFTYALKKLNLDDKYKDLAEKITTIIEEEHNYREMKNSSLLLIRTQNRSNKENNDNGDDREIVNLAEVDPDHSSFIYREGILKKYTQSALYLDKKEEDERSKAAHLFYAIAAGTAMAFSLGLTVFISQKYQQNSAPFIFAAVIIYMFKDRIKEIIRMISDKFLIPYFVDRKYKIIGNYPKNKTKSEENEVGIVKERVKFISKSEVPPQILNIRLATIQSSIEQEGKPEKIILYHKSLKIFSGKIKKIYNRTSDLVDIIRMNIRNFIRYADDPLKIEDYFDPNSKIVKEVQCSKVYHINLIFRLRIKYNKKKEKISYRRIRLIVDQKGIKYIEEIPIG
ncbi:MAG: hypothetical protein ACTSU2_15205 [Promethearchaeota archaeon]